MGNIVIVGVFSKGSTNISQAKAFSYKGYNVIPVSYRGIIRNYGQDYFYKYIKYVVDSKDPKLILFSKCNGVDPKTIKECSEKHTTWLWNMDARNTIETCMEVVEHAINCTYSSCTSPNTVDWFKSLGVNNCYYILEGIDTSIIKPVDYDIRYKADISFIGTKTKLRDEYIDFLSSNGYNVKAYGHGYNKEVVDEEFSKVCSSSKYMLSLNTHNNIPEYFSDRIMRYLGCKTLTFHYDTTETLNKYFKDNEEIIYFNSKEDLLNKLESIEDKDELVNSIKEKGYQKVINNYTWGHSIDKILGTIK